MTMSTSAERLRLVLYRALAGTGAMPTRSVLASEAGVAVDDLPALLDELAESRHVVLEDGEVVLAHPFATRSFRFSVMGPTTLWWGGCAWDAFAIPHLVPDAPSVLVATTCPACGTAHAWTVDRDEPPAGDQVAHFLVPAAEIWPDAAHACEHQQIFCDRTCVERWLTATGNRVGSVMSLATLWRLASHWYDGRLGTPYERREPLAAAEYFRSVGLTGPFWGNPTAPEEDEAVV